MIEEELYARLVAGQAAPGGLLVVFGTLGEIYLLARDGEVVIDRDDGVLHPAGAADREFAHVQAARRYPELRQLIPRRPPAARPCPDCGGTGEVVLAAAANRICCATCNTRGWV